MPPNYPGSTSTTYDSNSQLTSTTTDSEMLHMLDFEFDSSGNGGNGNTAKCHTGNSYTVSTTLGIYKVTEISVANFNNNLKLVTLIA